MGRVPGITAAHAIITPRCRRAPRPHLDTDPAVAAFEATTTEDARVSIVSAASVSASCLLLPVACRLSQKTFPLTPFFR